MSKPELAIELKRIADKVKRLEERNAFNEWRWAQAAAGYARERGLRQTLEVEADTLFSEAKTARIRALEEAAKVAEYTDSEDIADAIRFLMKKP